MNRSPFIILCCHWRSQKFWLGGGGIKKKIFNGVFGKVVKVAPLKGGKSKIKGRRGRRAPALGDFWRFVTKVMYFRHISAKIQPKNLKQAFRLESRPPSCGYALDYVRNWSDDEFIQNKVLGQLKATKSVGFSRSYPTISVYHIGEYGTAPPREVAGHLSQHLWSSTAGIGLTFWLQCIWASSACHFGSSSSNFDLWSRLWGFIQLLGLRGVPPFIHLSEGIE